MEFSRQDYWSGLALPSPRDLPDPGIEPWFPALQADFLPSEPEQVHRQFIGFSPNIEDHINSLEDMIFEGFPK